MHPKVCCFADFCHHHLGIMSAHTNVHRYPLFESDFVNNVEQVKHYYINTKNDSKIDFLTMIIDLCTAGYSESIIDVLWPMGKQYVYDAVFDN